MRVLSLTAQRKGQWLRYRPEFVEGDTIVFPASVMKGKKVHSIPITPLTAETIADRLFTGFSEVVASASFFDVPKPRAGRFTTFAEQQQREWRS